MNRLLNRLERKYGRYAPPGLTQLLVFGMGLAFVANMAYPGLVDLLELDPGAIARGQIWRVVTWMILPPSLSPIWLVFALMITHMIGTQLEAHWGPFRYQVFVGIGAVATLATALLTGAPASNSYLLMSLFLAFATLWPDYQFLIFFILPVKVKWLALLDGLVLIFAIATSHGWYRLLPIIAVGNYLLFFHRDLIALVRGGVGRTSRARALGEFQRKAKEAAPGERKCAKCGASNRDPEVELRVCFCDKHDGEATDFCMAHIRDH